MTGSSSSKVQLGDGLDAAPKLTRSEQNRINRTTKGGRTRDPLYDVCRGVQRQQDWPVADEFSKSAALIDGKDGLDALLDAVSRTVGPRPSQAHRLFPRDVALGFVEGNFEWVQRRSSPAASSSSGPDDASA